MALKVNIDFEKVLASGSPERSYPAINRELEFLAFWFESEEIVVHRSYDSAYLEYIERMSGTRPKLVSRAIDIKNWWGNLKNWNEAKRLSSKIENIRFGKQLGVMPITFDVLNSATDLLNYLNANLSTDFVLYQDFSFAGRGHHWVNREELKNKEIKYPQAIAPVLDRSLDIGSFLVDGVWKHTLGRCCKRGHFWGADYIGEDLSSYSWGRQLKSDLKKINDNLNTDSFYQIDSFVYGQESLLVSLCEINPRKTLGYILYLLHRKFHSKYSRLILVKNEHNQLMEQLIQIEKILLLSPADTKFLIFYIRGDSSEDLDHLESGLRKILVKGS